MNAAPTLAYSSPEALTFGRALRPVRCGFDLVVGEGQVFPEVNFTLPEMPVDRAHLPAILDAYHAMVTDVLARLAALDAPGAMIEVEHTPQMTEVVEIGAEVTAQTKRLMRECFERDGLRTALRVTVCDLRDKERPPRLRTGDAVQRVFDAFRENARRGADLLSIESTGGKEVSDRALMEADVPGLLLALGILAPRDMHFLWSAIAAIARDEQVIPAGDTACAFANTAMVLADRRYIPNVLAAVVRAMSAARSLVAFEEGAVGPSKDCAYEGPVLKAVTGCPISLEGKSAACAHFSHVGNIASATCDLWSNESVQNVRLLSGFAPEVFAEILAYDCRLMNQALASGQDAALRRLLIESDRYKSVHAFIISPDASFALAQAIVEESSDFARTRRAGRVACRLLREAADAHHLALPDRERVWLDRIEEELDRYADEDCVLATTTAAYRDAFLPAEYGL